MHYIPNLMNNFFFILDLQATIEKFFKTSNTKKSVSEKKISKLKFFFLPCLFRLF